MRKNSLVLMYSLFLCSWLSGQDEGFQPFIQGELRYGKALQSTVSVPLKSQLHLLVSFGSVHDDPDHPQEVFLRYPSTGLQLAYANFGNPDYLGHGISLLPFIEMPLTRNPAKALSLKTGLGVGYISKIYHPETNPENLAVGSHFNWNYELFLQYRIPVGKRSGLRFGLGFVHHSNGHTRLPNLGLNSVAANLSYRWNEFPADQEPIDLRKRVKPPKTRRFYMSVRLGVGLHEFGGRDFPIGGVNKAVYSAAIEGGCTFRQTVRLKLALGYRFYQAYYDHIKENEPPEYSDQPIRYSSNSYIGLGAEVLLGHVGMDFEGGINLYKPYYRVQWELFESQRETEVYYQVKNTFLVRIGLKGYLISTRKDPKHNLFAGAHINTNYEQADFSEFSLGYLVKIGKVLTRN